MPPSHRDGNVAAPLKRVERRPERKTHQGHRDGNVAAPLKHAFGERADRLIDSHRDGNVAAPLKHDDVLAVGRGYDGSPRRQRRGSIEALSEYVYGLRCARVTATATSRLH